MQKYPSGDELRELFVYEPASGALLYRHSKGRRITAGQRAGNVTRDGYRTVKVAGRTLQSSWAVWIYHNDVPPADTLDHINAVRLDDRIENLREATRSQNCMAKRKFYRPNRFGYRGIKANGRGKYSVSVVAGQKSFYVGTFSSVEEAARAYDKAALVYHGEYAQLNFPTKVQRDWLFVGSPHAVV